MDSKNFRNYKNLRTWNKNKLKSKIVIFVLNPLRFNLELCVLTSISYVVRVSSHQFNQVTCYIFSICIFFLFDWFIKCVVYYFYYICATVILTVFIFAAQDIDIHFCCSFFLRRCFSLVKNICPTIHFSYCIVSLLENVFMLPLKYKCYSLVYNTWSKRFNLIT